MKERKTLLGFPDWERAALLDVVDLARDLKGGRARGWLGGKVVVLYFANPSLRTRASVEAACARLGASAVVLDAGSGGVWGLEHRDGVVMDGTPAEHVKEAARVLSKYGDAIGVRVFASLKNYAEDRDEAVFSALLRASRVPLINLESAFWHPCQALADGLALQQQFGEQCQQKKFVLAWCYHPKALPMAVPNSALTTAARMGFDITVLRPEGFDLDAQVMDYSRELAHAQGGSLRISSDRDASLAGANVVYAKAWGGVGAYDDPAREQAAREAQRSWRLSTRDLALGDDPYFMHCLPVRRNVEVDDAVIDAPRSLTQAQAMNRLHAQKAILEWVWQL